MQSIHNFLIANKTKLRENCIHIFCCGFEKRCLAYPKALAGYDISQKNKIFCLILPSNIGSFPLSEETKNKEELAKLFQASSFVKLEEILTELIAFKSARNIFIDVSSMPRLYIFKILNFLFTEIASLKDKSIYIIYTYPKKYIHDALQEPDCKLKYVYDDVFPTKKCKCSIIMFPGFDLDYTKITVSILMHETFEPTFGWFLPFPGREYLFYERALKAHISFFETQKAKLYHLEEMGLFHYRLNQVLDSIDDDTIFMVPLAPRFICVPIFLATQRVKQQKKINICYPSTKRYNSIRSEGYVNPLIWKIA